MTRRDDIEDFREWKLHHPPGWWRRPRIRPDNREVAVAYCEMGFEIIPLWPSSKSPALRSPHEWFSPERGTCHGECGQLGHGFYDARADAAWADEYWRAHPDHGIESGPLPAWPCSTSTLAMGVMSRWRPWWPSTVRCRRPRRRAAGVATVVGTCGSTTCPARCGNSCAAASTSCATSAISSSGRPACTG